MNTLNSIIKYISFCEKQYSLFVSIHCFKPPLNSLMPLLGKYNTHYHPYCMYIKSHPELWKKCRTAQMQVLDECQSDIFYRECYFGVCEYVIPIIQNEEKIGFICISGFADDIKNTTKKISCEYNLDYAEISAVSKLLSKKHPDKDFIIATLQHIADALSLYSYVLPPQIVGNDNANYIYSNALAYIHENYKEPITVDDIALFCKCSRSYITKLFKNNGDICIKTYITNLRMHNAKKLLKTTKKSINEIAFSLGYNDSNYFSNAFYKNVGIYPRKYRDENII